MSARLPSDLRARVLAEARAAPSPTRGVTQKRTLIATGGGVAVTLVLFLAQHPLQLGDRGADLVLSTAGLALVVALALTQLSVRRGPSMLGRPRSHLALALAVGAAVLLASAFVVLLRGGDVETVGPKAHVACGAVSLVQGAALFAALLFPRRASDPIHPALTGAALGLAAGAWTATMAYLRCPHADSIHCLLGHVVPAVLFGMAGALIGRRYLRLR